SVNGLEAYQCVDGAFNGERFCQFLDGLDEGLLENKHIIMDNARWHYNQQAQDKIRNAGANVIFNAPYSPQLNPIEEVFGLAKTRYRQLGPLADNRDIIRYGDMLTLFLEHKSLREFPLITAYSLAQIADPHSAVASFNSQNQQNGPHAVENPIQNYRCSDDSIPQAVLPKYPYAAYDIFIVQSAVVSSVPLKLVHAFSFQGISNLKAVLFNFIANVFLDLPLAPIGALVYLIPLDASSVMGESMKFSFDISNDCGCIDNDFRTSPSYIHPLTQSECCISANRPKQSLDLNGILIKKLNETQVKDYQHPLANVTKLVAPALHKVLPTISGPAGMFHPGIEGTLGANANLAGAVDRLVNKW
ncbi:MAG: hypothetical protein EZS28_039743, partial [Streblomastix strix]